MAFMAPLRTFLLALLLTLSGFAPGLQAQPLDALSGNQASAESESKPAQPSLTEQAQQQQDQAATSAQQLEDP